MVGFCDFNSVYKQNLNEYSFEEFLKFSKKSLRENAPESQCLEDIISVSTKPYFRWVWKDLWAPSVKEIPGFDTRNYWTSLHNFKICDSIDTEGYLGRAGNVSYGTEYERGNHQ